MQPKAAAWYHAGPMVRELFTRGGVEVGSWLPTMQTRGTEERMHERVHGPFAMSSLFSS